MLKEASITAPVLGYPDFNREFVLETDASLQDFGALLSQQDESGKLCAIAYASWSLHLSKRSMHNYSSAKIELLVLKWAIMEKFCDHFLGWKFHVYTDNNPLAYVRESRLSTSQIWWLGELALFDFTIHYQTGRSNHAANTLSSGRNDDDSKIEWLKQWWGWRNLLLNNMWGGWFIPGYHQNARWPQERSTIYKLCSITNHSGGRSRENWRYVKCCICHQSGNIWEHGRKTEERPYPYNSLPIHYSQGKVKIIGHC